MRVVVELADKWEKDCEELYEQGEEYAGKMVLHCANQLRSAVAAVREGSE